MLKIRVLRQLSYPILRESRIDVNPCFLVAVISISEVPHGSEFPFVCNPQAVTVLIEKTTAVITLAVLHYLLHEVVFCGLRDVQNISNSRLGICRRGIERVVDSMNLVLDIIALSGREDFRLFERHHDLLSVSFEELDISFGRVVVNLYEPSSRYGVLVCLVVILLNDIHAVSCDPHMFREEIKPHILSVEYQFDGSRARCPSQSQRFADTKSRRHFEKSQPVVGGGHETPVPVVGHAEHFLFDVKLDLIGFLVESVPRPVAAPFYCSAYRCVSRA